MQVPISIGLIILFFSQAVIAQTVKIDPTYHQANLNKTGYKLLFHDEFDALDTTIWNRSAPGNDAPDYSNEDFIGKSNNTPPNPSNVLEPNNGILQLRIRKGEDYEKAGYSGGEIKSFDNHSWSNNPNGYKNWAILPGTYLETRIKVPQCPGINAAFWLYGIIGAQDDPERRFFEVDMLESYSEKRNYFISNLHYGVEYHSKTHRSKQKKIQVKTQDGLKPNLRDLWLTLGIEWKDDKIKMYLNGALYNQYTLKPNSKRTKNKYLKALPSFIRIGVGKSSIEDAKPDACPDLPQYLEVDYVRLYAKEDEKAIKFLDDYSDLVLSKDRNKPNSGRNIRVNYIPGVKYSWSNSEDFNIERNANYANSCNCEQWWISVKPNASAGQKELELTVEFLDGIKEVLHLKIKIEH